MSLPIKRESDPHVKSVKKYNLNNKSSSLLQLKLAFGRGKNVELIN